MICVAMAVAALTAYRGPNTPPVVKTEHPEDRAVEHSFDTLSPGKEVRTFNHFYLPENPGVVCIFKDDTSPLKCTYLPEAVNAPTP